MPADSICGEACLADWQKPDLVFDGPMPDVFIHGRPAIEKLQDAFAEAFRVPAPSVFDGEDTSVSFVDFIDRHTVATFWRLDHEGFSTKLDIYLFEREDMTEKLGLLAKALGMPVAVDIGGDIEDDRAVLFTPDGTAVAGYSLPAD